MFKPRLIATRGLPGSGKTTWAKKMVQRRGYKRINKDDLRTMIDCGKYSKGNERVVLVMRDALIKESLFMGRTVIVDDTNFEEKHMGRFRELATQYGVAFEIKDFTDVSIKECIRRDLIRPNSVGHKVILGMYQKYLAPQLEPIVRDVSLPSAIICDIDGTLAKHHNRSPFEYEGLNTDTLIVPVYDALVSLSELVHTVIIMSGRPSDYKEQTERWLFSHGVSYNGLFMRPKDDYRSDDIVKEELFRQHVAPYYNVRWVLDDRDRVVEMWRRLGLTCFQVAWGSF